MMANMDGEHPYDRLLRRERARKERNKKYKWINYLIAYLALALCVLTGAWMLAVNVDVRPVRCTVVSAAPDSSSGGSRGSASTAGVRVETEQCGPIKVSQGVTFDTEEEVARGFEPGSVWEFDLSWGDRVVNREWLHIVPGARNQRLVEPAPSGPASP